MTDSTEASFFHSVCLVQVWPTVYGQISESEKLEVSFEEIIFGTYNVCLWLGVELNVPDLEGLFSGGVGVPILAELS